MRARACWTIAMAVAVIGSGCGTVSHPDVDGASGTSADAGEDAMPDAGGERDARSGARCSPTAPFTDVRAIDELNTDDLLEEDARMSPDMLTVYFARGQVNTTFDVMTATRSTPDGVFGELAVAGVSTETGSERSPTVSADGLSMVAVQRVGATFRLAFAEREDTDSDFGALTSLDILNSTAVDANPYLLPDMSAIYFASSRSGSTDLYRAAHSALGFGAPELVKGTQLNLPATLETAPVVSADELTMYYAATAQGEEATQRLDVYVTTRSSADGDFGPPQVVEMVTTAENHEWPGWISPDGCTLTFTRTAGDSAAGYDLYVATREATP